MSDKYLGQSPKIFHETSQTRPPGKQLHHCTECGTEFWGNSGLNGAVAWCEVCWEKTKFKIGRHSEVAERIGPIPDSKR